MDALSEMEKNVNSKIKNAVQSVKVYSLFLKKIYGVLKILNLLYFYNHW